MMFHQKDMIVKDYSTDDGFYSIATSIVETPLKPQIYLILELNEVSTNTKNSSKTTIAII